jgi:hypothetical protein
MNTNDHVMIRFSRADDAAAISRLAQLDSARPPHGRLLVAEVAGELRAALALDGGAAVADPFHHTLEIVSLLELRRGQLQATTRRSAMTRAIATDDVAAGDGALRT